MHHAYSLRLLSVFLAIILLLAQFFVPVQKRVVTLQKNLSWWITAKITNTTFLKGIMNYMTEPLVWQNRLYELEMRNRSQAAQIIILHGDLEKIVQESRQLASLSGAKKNIITAQVSKSSGQWIVFAGSQQGVMKGSIVRKDGFLIGQITAVHKFTSTLSTLSDQALSLSLIHQRSKAIGAWSHESGRFRVRFFSPIDDIRPGDALISGGDQDFIPNGIPIGFVDHVQKDPVDPLITIDVRPGAVLLPSDVIVIEGKQ